VKIGDLVKLKTGTEIYGFIVCIQENKWIGSRCAVVWLQDGFPKKWYALVELEVLNESR